MIFRYFLIFTLLICIKNAEEIHDGIFPHNLKNKFLLVPYHESYIRELYNHKTSINSTESVNTMNNLKRKLSDDRSDNKNCPPCSCGLANRRRIVGGTIIRTNKYPWTAQLSYMDRFYCGAALINDQYLLTAAHCTKGFNKDYLTVKLLQVDRTTTVGIKRNVEMIIRPYGYSIETLANDISLVKMDRPIPINGDIRPVCLPPIGKSFTNEIGVVAGWGAKIQNGRPTTLLHELEVPILSNSQCRKTVYENRITPTMLCAGYLEGGKDACQGDSGGPLIVSNDYYFALAGIVSWGYGCAQPNSPGVYTRVTKYVRWILDNTKDACYCANSF